MRKEHVLSISLIFLQMYWFKVSSDSRISLSGKMLKLIAKLAILIMKLIFLKIFLNGKQVYQKVYLLYTDSLNLVYVSLVRILKDEFL